MKRSLKKSNLMAIASLCVAVATLVPMTTGSALAAEKTIKNSTNVDVEVQVGVAAGSPEKEGMRSDRVKIKAGGIAKVVYGNEQNPFIHELLIHVKESQAKSENSQFQWVTARGDRPTWDNTLNANSTLTIEALGKFDVNGSNGDEVQSGSKRIVNKTDTDLDVVLTPREGDSTKLITIKKGETKVVQFGNASNPYLDGIHVQWQDSTLKSGNRQERFVEDKGAAPTWDATLNTNNTLTITGVSPMKVTGSDIELPDQLLADGNYAFYNKAGNVNLYVTLKKVGMSKEHGVYEVTDNNGYMGTESSEDGAKVGPAPKATLWVLVNNGDNAWNFLHSKNAANAVSYTEAKGWTLRGNNAGGKGNADQIFAAKKRAAE